MEERKCIICNTTKEISLFNEEHIIPAALGGSITIRNVCQPCNSHLGKTIDYNLLKNNAILYYRNVFKISRQSSGSVPNPFKGKHYDSKGNPHLVYFNQNGKMFTQSLENFSISNMPGTGGAFAKLEIPAERINEIDEIIEKQFKRNKIEFKDYKIANVERNEPTEQVEIKAIIDNNSFIFGCLKIAYEIAVSLFPSFIEDPFAESIRHFIQANKLTEELSCNLEESAGLNDFYNKKLSSIDNLSPNHHLIIVEYLEDVGFICVVRLFTLMCPIILSKSFKLLNLGNEIIFFNDSISGTHATNINYSIASVSFALEFLGLPTELRDQLIRDQDESFFKTNNKISVFNSSGQLIFENIEDLARQCLAVGASSYYWAQESVVFDLSKGDFWLKSIEETLIKMLSLTTTRQIILQRITK